jgi:GNAT superfamily N-acetyltransferase
LNSELRELFEADRRERDPHPVFGTPEYKALRARDAARRKRVDELLAQAEATRAALDDEDHYHAALIYQHGDEVDEVAKARACALKAAELGHAKARWLAAAALDRWLMYQGKPQKYGTNMVPDGERTRVWDVDSGTNDAERAAWDVPPIAEMERRAAEVSAREKMPPMDQAPWWLKEALKRWKAEGLRIFEAEKPGHIDVARMLFKEYGESLGFKLCFQGFDEELATLPGRYARPEGRLLLATFEGLNAGCVALRKLEDGICEMKRMYVRPAFRGKKIGRVLAERIVEEARIAGYLRMRLDTIATMREARALYASLGFKEMAAPYTHNPIKGAVFMELALR